MLITLFFMIATVVFGILLEKDNSDIDRQFSWGIAILFSVMGLSACIIIIIIAHCATDNKILCNNIEYESLSQRAEIINSEYEDISKSDIIKDIGEWNIKVQNEKYWSNNLFTNWFYSKKFVDNLKTIDYE